MAATAHKLELYDDASYLSAAAGEKFMKSCPGITNNQNHKAQELFQDMSTLMKVQRSKNDIKFLGKVNYNNRYGDSYIEATQQESLRRLKIACDIKEDIYIYWNCG
ncbi:hypothetical protein PBV87_06805 [Niameybacter massiliensis]|uniref:Uncharacterized protein n=1 Tax=Holtiella tumoricola TaxID=3018743 RepID=A0AA42J098_9FIRM|nr:hypothetical protein [Holtiella tumoricola]MDA3731195.1 hypothetical protein [Holtiella tumoricola]